MEEKIRYPKSPECIRSLERYQGLKNNWDYSYARLEQLNKTLRTELGNIPVSIVVAGSFGRLEACEESDLDFMIICQDRIAKEQEIIERVLFAFGV